MADRSALLRLFLPFALAGSLFAATSVAQRISILPQPESEISLKFSQSLLLKLNERRFRVDDLDLSQAAAASLKISNRLNMETKDARRLGTVLGNPMYVLVNAQNQRRTSSQGPIYYEGSASVYLISSSTGGLVKWDLISVKESTAEKADQGLLAATEQVAETIAIALKAEVTKMPLVRNKFPPVPDANAAGYEGLRPPMPFRRISPPYTTTANLYGVEATVEIEADIDGEGKIVTTEIVRWAGYGLDESVKETIHKMTWRPATIGNRTLPMRVLLRYNFRKIENNDEN